MAHFARVGRETLYAMQPPFEFNEDAARLQESMNVQTAWKRQYSFNMPKKQRKVKKHDVHADSTAAMPHGGANHSLTANSHGHLAPSLPVAAPSTPAPSSEGPPSPESTPKQRQEVPSTQQDGKNPQKMTQISAYVPPHLRKKQQGLAKTPTKNSAATEFTNVEAARASLAQVKLEPVYGQPQAPPSPPSSPPDVKQAPEWGLPNPATDAEAQMNEAWGCGEPAPEPTPQPKKRRNGRWPSPPPRPRKGRHVWPKNRDMKPVSDDEEDGGIEYKSDSNGDPDYDVKKLMDWNGDWLPPPETWSARHAFTDRHFGASLEKWMNGHAPSCTDNYTHLLVLPGFKGIEANGTVVTMELAPRDWIPSSIEGDAPQSFWHAFLDRAPAPLSDIDMSEYLPYWEDYQPHTVFLKPLQHPEKSILDMNDDENTKPGVSQTTEQTLETIASKKFAREQRRQKRLNRPITMPEFTPRPGYRPTSNVYFRPVVPADAKGIQELYNYYVEKTISVPEFEPRSGRAIVDRISAIIDQGLPYIVAVHKGFRLNGPQDYVNESIVGFACMEDFCARDSMYRFTFELECYVHPDFLRQNIAKCLLDRLLEMVNTSYPAKGGYDWINHGEYLKHGCSRVVKVVNCNVPHDADDDMAWMTTFLKKFNFRKAGHMHKMGYKYGKVVDVTIYQHETSETIDATVPPLIFL